MKILIRTVEGNLEVEDSSETIDIKIRGEPTRQLVLGLTPDSGPVRGAAMKFFRGDVEGSDTIKSVKEKIQDKKGFLVADQRLVYHGKQLEDGRTIADCNIQDGSILNIFLRP